MKKNEVDACKHDYVKPQAKVILVSPSSIICQSDPDMENGGDIE